MTFLKFILMGIVLSVLIIPSVILAQSPPLSSKLTDLAQTQGQVRVIVRLNLPFQPEGYLNRARALDQRAKIAETQNRLLQRFRSVTVHRRYQYVPYLALTVDLATRAQLAQAAEVMSINEDTAEFPLAVESVPVIGADQAWAAGYSGAGWTVAVLDTGVESSHDFLAGKVVAEACYSSTDPKSQTLCPNGKTFQFGPGAGVNCSINGCEHGTHVAGIAVGNGAGGFGVAKDATLISIQVFSRYDSETDCNGKPAPCIFSASSDQMAALELIYALRSEFNLAAVNMSIGGEVSNNPCDNDPRAAIVQTLRSVNIAVVVSAGNDSNANGLTRPACISQTISVGATNNSDTILNFSNSSTMLDLLAPGYEINSSIPGNTFGPLSGTSMAAPHVAGAWAILKSKFPTGTVGDVYATLANTGIPITDPRNGLTKPRIQIDAALLPNASLSQQVNITNPSAKQPLTYTIRLTNSGLLNLREVSMTAFWHSSLSITASNLLFSNLTLPTNKVLIITLPTTISTTLPAHTELTNTLVVTASNLPQTLTKTFSIKIASYPNVTISKMANVTQAVVGQVITFTYQVTNTGNLTLTSLLLKDTNAKLGRINLNITELGIGQTVSQTLKYTVMPIDLTIPLTQEIVLDTFSVEGDRLVEVAPSEPLTVVLRTIYLPMLLKER